MMDKAKQHGALLALPLALYVEGFIYLWDTHPNGGPAARG